MPQKNLDDLDAEFREVLKESGLSDYFDWFAFYPPKVQLDGDYSLEQLRLLVSFMEKNQLSDR